MANKIFGAIATTGGTSGALDSIKIATLTDGDLALVGDSTEEGYVYRFESSSTAAESNPQAVRPDDYSTAGVWILTDMSMEDLKVYGNAVIDGTLDVTGVTTLGSFTYTGNLTVPDSGLIIWDNSPSTDENASGDVTVLTAGENLVFGNVCFIETDGKLWKADADANTTMPAFAMALAAISADATGNFLLRGFVRDDSWNWTVGGVNGLIYIDTTAGALTQTEVSGSGDQLQIVGVAYTADIMYFNPQYNIVEIS